MRQVFSSNRLENAEGVEKLLNEAGIATKITQGRSWKGVSRREFSYTAKPQDAGQQPAVWVLRSEDVKRARELLHDAGLLESTRDASYLPETLTFRDPKAATPQSRANRIRLFLLGAVAVGGGLMLFRVFLA